MRMWWCLNQPGHCLICTFCTFCTLHILHFAHFALCTLVIRDWWWCGGGPLCPPTWPLSHLHIGHRHPPSSLPAWKTHLARQGVPTNCPFSRPPSIWVTPRCIPTLCTPTQNGHYTATLKVGWVDVKVFWVYFSSQLLATQNLNSQSAKIPIKARYLLSSAAEEPALPHSYESQS